nr:hypothetical protein [Pseudomonas benzenivorans]
MEPSLQPDDPLSQVVFVHDYLQLVFQDCAFALYNLVTYTAGDISLTQGEAGFCDALVSLIEQAARVEVLPGELSLHFANGAIVSIASSGASTRGPEAWQFGRLGSAVVVEQNA